MTTATSKMESFLSLHKQINSRCYGGPRYASETIDYKNLKNKQELQMSNNFNNSKKLVNQIFGLNFLGAIFRGKVFRTVQELQLSSTCDIILLAKVLIFLTK